MTCHDMIRYIQKKILADFFAIAVKPHAPDRNYSPFQPVFLLLGSSLSHFRERKSNNFSLSLRNPFSLGGVRVYPLFFKSSYTIHRHAHSYVYADASIKACVRVE
ncbi:Uncharacterized protein Rs2_33100 [Raphanus sativus]|nr:Uncharacterized protein Rs2_33100 [Raphanus sativus]